MKEILITSSVMILAVMILRFLFRTKVNRRLVYGVWLLVALRLLVPIQFGQLDFSVLTQAKPVTDAITDIAQRPVSGPSREELYQDALRQEISQGTPVFIPEVQDRVDTEIQQSGRPAPEVYEEFLETNRSEEILLPEVSQKIEVTVTEKAAPNWGQIALWVWLAGSFGMAGWFLGVNISLRRSLRRNATDFAAECPIPVKVSAAISSPCLFGLLRPTIYLTPACTEDEQRLRHVLTHEQTHLRHGDHIWAWVRCLCLCIYWFNPLVWAAAYLSKRDCELACDEAALKTLGEEERLAYGKTLVDMVASHPAPGQLLETATAMHETKKQLKERVNRIVKKPKVFLTAAIALLLVLTIVTGCAFTGALTDPTSSNSTTPTDGTQPSTPTEGHEIIESTIHVDQQAVLPLIEALLNKNSDSISIVSFEYDRQGNCAILYRDTAASTDNDFYLMRLAHTSEGFRVITDTPYINTLPAYSFEFSEITSTAEWPDVLTAEALVSPRYGISATIPITDMTVNVSVPMVLPISEGAASINESIQKTYNAKLREIKRCIDDPYSQTTNILIDYDAHIGKDVLFIRVTHYRQSTTKTELTPYDRYYYYLDLLNGEQLDLIDLIFRDGWQSTDPTDPTTTPTEPTTVPTDPTVEVPPTITAPPAPTDPIEEAPFAAIPIVTGTADLPSNPSVADLLLEPYTGSVLWFDEYGNEYDIDIELPLLVPFCDGAKAINEAIRNEFQSRIDQINDNYIARIGEFERTVYYEAYLNGNVLSVIITRDSALDHNAYHIYNLDISTGVQLTTLDMVQRYTDMDYPEFLLRATYTIYDHLDRPTPGIGYIINPLSGQTMRNLRLALNGSGELMLYNSYMNEFLCSIEVLFDHDAHEGDFSNWEEKAYRWIFSIAPKGNGGPECQLLADVFFQNPELFLKYGYNYSNFSTVAHALVFGLHYSQEDAFLAICTQWTQSEDLNIASAAQQLLNELDRLR